MPACASAVVIRIRKTHSAKFKVDWQFDKGEDEWNGGGLEVAGGVALKMA